jgi:hypothetical protein
MRRVLSLIPVLLAIAACAKKETPPADTAAAAADVTPAAPVAVAESDVAGTWKGTSNPIGSDSVVARWTQVCAAGSCRGTTEGRTLVVESTYTLSGDSAVGVSKPYMDPEMKARVIDTWTVHFSGDNATGTGAMKLASKPDSVVMRYQFAGSRQR